MHSLIPSCLFIRQVRVYFLGHWIQNLFSLAKYRTDVYANVRRPYLQVSYPDHTLGAQWSTSKWTLFTYLIFGDLIIKGQKKKKCFQSQLSVSTISFWKWFIFLNYALLWWLKCKSNRILYCYIQSHYREVPRWGVSNGARHNWKCFLAYKKMFL